ncbi:MAG TPA: Sir2 family NAD-dependent protein deacetylase [Natronosporangium sp.]|nr:Sir2 family NAD-dependent protein deacetylase [Natronosporangium sp.]
MSMPTASEAEVAAWLAAAQRVTVLTGAGISTDSGIPDFRGPQGVWTRDPSAQALVTIDAYLADPQVRRRAWQARLTHPVWQAEPNAGHRALVDLERSGRLRALVTQNIDGLHQAAGSDPELVLELHGTVHWVRCLSCERRTPMREVLERVRAGEADPPCGDCGGIQKSATVSFGETLDPAVLAAAVRASRDCDLFIAAGTSLSVHPAAGLCEHALVAGARLVILNAQPTPYDPVADAVIRAPLGEVLPRLVAHVAPTDAPA